MNTSTDIVWKALPNSAQSLALDTRCHHTLFCGTRGGGKSAVQLMRFRRRVGLGYGSFWRGIIFDVEFKNLGDIVAQSKKFFNAFNDGAKFLESAQEYKWKWPTGEELLFRHIKKLSDYDNFHGHEYCLWEAERVVTDKGNVAIKNLQIGDSVLTPIGFRKITRKFNLGYKNCTKVEVYTSDGHLRYVQRQSVDHRLLTSKGVFSRLSLGSFQNVPLFDGNFCAQVASRKLPHGACAETLGIYAQQVCEGIYAKLSGSRNRNEQLNLLYRISVKLHVTLVQLYREIQQHLPISCHDSAISYVRLLLHKVKRIRVRLDHLRQLAQPELGQCRLLAYFHARLLDAHVELHTALSCLFCCPNDPCFYDALVHTGTGSVQCAPPFWHDALETNLCEPSDVKASVPENNHLHLCEIANPYTGKSLRNILQLSEGYCKSVPCGKLPVYDIEVDEANCYVTESGLINQNCFIGWNELTKWHNLDLYNKMMSVNRSSFVPTLHTPKLYGQNRKPLRNKNGEFVYDTPNGEPLPPIPLEVFSTTNPNGPGHNAVKRRFINGTSYGKVVRVEVPVFDPKTQQDTVVTKTQVTIFGSYRENIYLPAEYIAELDLSTRSNPNLARAWLEGDWDVTAGGALDDLWDSSKHVLPRFRTPPGWRIDRAFDWGSSHPFACCWFAEANGEEAKLADGRTFCPPVGTLIMIQELYGTAEIGSNKGLKLPASEVAKQIKAIDNELIDSKWITCKKVLPGPADNQIRDVREADVDTIEQKMSDQGVYWEHSDKSPGSRKIGLELVRESLAAVLRNDRSIPHLYFMDNCIATIELLPSLPRDEKNIDDVDTSSEEHLYDVVRYRCLKGKNRYPKTLDTRQAT